MRDHNPRHQSQILPTSQYTSFFADVSQTYQGQPVFVYPDSQLEHTTGDADPITFKGLTSVHKKRKDHITIRTAVDNTPQELTMIANMVWVIKDENDTLISLEIIDPQDKKLVLEFTHSI